MFIKETHICFYLNFFKRAYIETFLLVSGSVKAGFWAKFDLTATFSKYYKFLWNLFMALIMMPCGEWVS